jgi:hypothetical protein
MSTHDYVIANASGSSVRSDLNNALAAIVSNNSSSSEPSTKYAYMLWVDTTNNLIKLRNSANNAWITLFTTAGGLDVDAASNFNEDVTFTGASANVTWDKSVDDFIFNDNAKAAFGTSSDLSIYHDGTNSHLNNSTGYLIVGTDSYAVKDQTLNEFYIKALKDGAVELYYDNSKKLETNSSGTKTWGGHIMTNGGTVTGGNLSFADASKAIFGDDSDLQISHNTNSLIKHEGTGNLYLDSYNKNVYIRAGDGNTSVENSIVCNNNAAVELYHSGTKKFETHSGGVYAWGKIYASDDLDLTNDNKKINLGDSSDLQLFHDGSHSFIDNSTGELQIRAAYLRIRAKDDGEDIATFNDDAGVELFYDGVPRFATLNYGALVYGICETQGDVANNYVNHTFNDGNSANRYGSYIKCGTDDASGTNYALGVSDGNGTTQGYLTFSGGTLSLVAFTASHPCIIPDADNPSDDSMAYPYGTLLETISIEYSKSKKDGSDTERGIRYKVQKTQSANSRKVLGAYAGSMNGGPDGQTNEHDAYVLGDGHILVNNAGGNIEVGDGICSSATAGIGQKAIANPSMIIGIAQEAITFTGSETKLVTVQYGLQQFIPWS